MTVSLLLGAAVMRVKFTEKALEAKRRQALQDGKDVLLWDTELRGFGAKLSVHGRLSWLVQKWIGGVHGGSKRIVIGHCPPKDLATARKDALGIIAQVHQN